MAISPSVVADARIIGATYTYNGSDTLALPGRRYMRLVAFPAAGASLGVWTIQAFDRNNQLIMDLQNFEFMTTDGVNSFTWTYPWGFDLGDDVERVEITASTASYLTIVQSDCPIVG